MYSRRLGWSLGVNLVPFKTCTWNCVYCYLGYAQPVVERRRWIEERVVVEKVLEKVRSVHTDYVTLVGIGEPTLASNIGRVVELLKSEVGVRVAVLSNGSLFNRGVAFEVSEADYIKATITSVDEDKWRVLHNPAAPLNAEEFVEGLWLASRAAKSFHLEVMLVDGVNDSPEDAARLGSVIRELGVTSVAVNTPFRPGWARWVNPPAPERVLRFASILERVSGHRVEVLTGRGLRPPRIDPSKPGESLAEIVSTHILSWSEAVEALREAGVENPEDTLRELVETGVVKARRVGSETYLYRED